MKKLFSTILAFILTLSVAVFPAFAQTQSSSEPSWYLQRLFIHYPETQLAYECDELFYTEIGEMDVDTDDGIDYAIIHAHFAMAPDALDGGVIGDRFIITPQIYSPFRLGYALYDLEKDEFTPFSEITLDDYPFLSEYMEKYSIGTPFGDADCDRVLSVMDATYIQRVVAQLETFKSFDDISYYNHGALTYISDFNRDGSRDILDATGIQMKLASVPEEPLDENF